ncbi:MAG: AtpZ/AtpI family protein [Proteobacteria bacterium]|nr:AtpZ/AtpI family protein [Pseudomonadota bacterium]
MTDDLKNLEERIAQHKSGHKRRDEAAEEHQRRQMSAGMQAGTEFMTYVAAGGIVGFLADRFLDTLPLFLIVMIFAGFGYGIFRAAKTLK